LSSPRDQAERAVVCRQKHQFAFLEEEKKKGRKERGERAQLDQPDHLGLPIVLVMFFTVRPFLANEAKCGGPIVHSAALLNGGGKEKKKEEKREKRKQAGSGFQTLLFLLYSSARLQ